jgi:hypothetical protein
MRRPVLAALVLGAAALPALAYETAGMRDAMRSVFSSMRTLLELSQSAEMLADPHNERAILAAAGELADQASIISEHAPRDEMSFLAGSLDRHANWIRRSYEWGRHDTMQRLVHDAVDLCIACHTRLPSDRDSPLAESFLAGVGLSELPATHRARLELATRRFDDAMHTLESLLPAIVDEPGQFDQALRSYLVVALRVKGDPRRARQVLEQLAADDRVSAARREQLNDWAGALQHLEIEPPVAGDLATARELVNTAESKRDAARGEPLVEYVAASRLLYEFLEGGTGSIAEGAEAYYLLGLSQYRIESDAWLPQAELFLEKAIRTAPASAAARRALSLLRAKVEEGFLARGQEIPQEVVRHLQMLGDMVESRG